MKTYYLLLLLLMPTLGLFAQRTLQLSLEDIVALAKDDVSDELEQRLSLSIRTPDAQIAQTQLTNSYWNYQQFLTNYRPQISLNATLPSFSRSIDGITQPDGGIAFQSFSNMSNSIGGALSYPIAKTGGTVFVNTSFRRIDVFNSFGTSTSYFSNPISIGFNQPLFAFNNLKWDKVIQPLVYSEAKRRYDEDLEGAAVKAANLFFNVYIAKISLEAAKKDKANADTLYVISQGRFTVGKIAETELLQIEISKLNADGALASATLDLQTSTENLRNFLGINEAITFELTPPTNIPNVVILPAKALESAKANRSKIIEFDRRLKVAERNVDRAAKDNGFSANISGQFGLSQTNAEFSKSFYPFLDQEQVRITVQVPIMDGGRANARKQIATSNQELVRMNVKQERINFDRDILLKVKQFDLVRNQTKLALKNFEVSQKTYDLTRKRYLIGKIGVIDLNLALADQDRSRRNYMGALRSFWLAYYEIRRLTLYDFINDKPLNSNLEELLKQN